MAMFNSYVKLPEGNYQPQMVGLFLGLPDSSIFMGKFMESSWDFHIELPISSHQSIEGCFVVILSYPLVI